MTEEPHLSPGNNLRESNQTDANKLKGNPINWLSLVEGLAKSIGGIGLLFYAIGFVIVKTYLSQFGIEDLALLSPRYISAGVLYLSILGITIIGVATLCLLFLLSGLTLYQFHSNRSKRRRKTEKEPIALEDSGDGQIGEKRNWVLNKKQKWAVGILILLFLVAGIEVLQAVHRVLVSLIYGKAPLSLSADYGNIEFPGLLKLRLWYLDFWILLNGLWPFIWFLILLLVLVYITFKLDLFDDNSRKIVKLFIYGAQHFFLPLLIGILVLHNINTYALNVFPLVDRSIGGGRATKVQLITEISEKPKKLALADLLPLATSGDIKTIPVCLLEQSDKNYYVLLGTDGKTLPDECIVPKSSTPEANIFRAIQVDKGLVKGIVYLGNHNH